MTVFTTYAGQEWVLARVLGVGTGVWTGLFAIVGLLLVAIVHGLRGRKHRIWATDHEGA